MEVTSTTRSLVDNVLGNLKARYEALDMVGVSGTGVQAVSSSGPITPFPAVQPRVVVTQQAGAPQQHFSSSAGYDSSLSIVPTATTTTIAQPPPATSKHVDVSAPNMYPTLQQQQTRIEEATALKKHIEAANAAHKYAPVAASGVPPTATQPTASHVTGTANVPFQDIPIPTERPSTPPFRAPSSGAEERHPPVNDAAFSPRVEAEDVERRLLVDQVMRDMGFAVGPPPGANDQQVANYLLANAATAQSPINASTTAGDATVERTQMSHIHQLPGGETPANAAPGATPMQEEASAAPVDRAPPEVLKTAEEVPVARNPADVPQPTPHQHFAQHAQQQVQQPMAAVHVTSIPTAQAPATARVPTANHDIRPVSTSGSRPVSRPGTGGSHTSVGAHRAGGTTIVQVMKPALTSLEIDDMLSKRDTPLDGKERDTLLRAAERAYGGVVGTKDITSRMQKAYPNILLRKHQTPSIDAVMRKIAVEADRLRKNPVVQDGTTRRPLPSSRSQRRSASAVANSRQRPGCGSRTNTSNFVAVVEDPKRAHRLVAHNTAKRRVSSSQAPLPKNTEPYYPARGTGKSKVDWRASSVTPKKPAKLF